MTTDNLANTDLMTLLLGAVISVISQFSKRHLPALNPMLLVAILSIVLGGLWVGLRSHGLIPDELIQTMIGAFSAAVVIYNVAKAAGMKLSSTTSAPVETGAKSTPRDGK